jgi:hypothetical protein
MTTGLKLVDTRRGGAMRTCVNAFSVVGQTALLIQHALFAGASGGQSLSGTLCPNWHEDTRLKLT